MFDFTGQQKWILTGIYCISIKSNLQALATFAPEDWVSHKTHDIEDIGRVNLSDRECVVKQQLLNYASGQILE